MKRLPKPDLFIYLQAGPETCYQRMCKRSRGEESGVTLDYLEDLHYFHDQIFIHKPRLLPAPVKVIYGTKGFYDLFGIKSKMCSKCQIIKPENCYYKIKKVKMVCKVIIKIATDHIKKST